MNKEERSKFVKVNTTEGEMLLLKETIKEVKTTTISLVPFGMLQKALATFMLNLESFGKVFKSNDMIAEEDFEYYNKSITALNESGIKIDTPILLTWDKVEIEKNIYENVGTPSLFIHRHHFMPVVCIAMSLGGNHGMVMKDNN